MKTVEYGKFSTNGEAKTEGSVEKRWWLLPKDQLANAVSRVVKTLGQADGKRQTQYQISTRLYGNTNIMGVNGLSFSKINSSQNSTKDRL
jgi:hypothetical protein